MGNIVALITGFLGAAATVTAAVILRPQSGSKARELPEGTPQSVEVIRYVYRRGALVAGFASLGGLGVGLAVGLLSGDGADGAQTQVVTRVVTQTGATVTVQSPEGTSSTSSTPAPQATSEPRWSDTLRLNSSGYALGGAAPDPSSSDVEIENGRIRWGSSVTVAAWSSDGSPSDSDCADAISSNAYSAEEATYGGGVPAHPGLAFCFRLDSTGPSATDLTIGYLKVESVERDGTVAKCHLMLWDADS